MRADPAAQNALLDLQAQDAVIAQLTHRRGALPEHAVLTELNEQRAEIDRGRVAADTDVSDLTAEQRKADAEVEQVKARRTRDEERLGSGVITNPKDLTALQHELGALERRISTLEDKELEVMERLEEAQKRLDSATADLADVTTKIEHTEAARDAATGEIDDQVAAAHADRELVLPKVPEDLLALYEKVRTSKGGVGAAALRARRCEGCMLELNGADLRDLAGQADDEVLRCPECSRILVRTAESGI